jgi:hypothetical protein
VKSIKLAVFGHYDSRGGTTGIRLPDAPTPADIDKTVKEYNKVFAWEDTLKEYAAKPEMWEWNPTEPGSSPGENDFMFVADLWYDGNLPEGDLEEVGIVVKDEDTDVGDKPIGYYLDHPVQLEFINLKMGRYESQGDQDEDIWVAAMTTLVNKLDKSHELVIPNWNDDAFGFIVGTGLEAE